MHDFPQHTRDLAKAIAIGDLEGAASALDMMGRDEERCSSELIARGRADACRINGRPALPQLAVAA